jgi:hypothetical protein
LIFVVLERIEAAGHIEAGIGHIEAVECMAAGCMVAEHKVVGGKKVVVHKQRAEHKVAEHMLVVQMIGHDLKVYQPDAPIDVKK